MSFYDATVPAYLQVLGSLSGLLTKAELAELPIKLFTSARNK